MGVQGQPVGQPRALSTLVAGQLREELQNADAGHARRARFPGSHQSGAGAFYRAATPRNPIENGLFPGRRALGSEAAELEALVPDRWRLVRSVAEVSRFNALTSNAGKEETHEATS